MLLNKKQATDLAKSWRLGNKFRKKSLTKKHNLAPAASKNTGRVKMGIRMDIESKPREYYPALDDDGSLIFFTGNPMKRIQVSDLFVPPKAPKNRQRVPAKESTMINYKEKFLTTLFPNEEPSILEEFSSKLELDVNDYSIFDIKRKFKAFQVQIDERTEYQLVAQKTDGTELKSSWYKTENELAELQQKCEDSDDYQSTSVMKRIVDVDEDEDNEEEFGSILPTEYTDGEEIEGEQNFSEDDIEEHDRGNKDKEELFKLTTLALKQIPGSPKQRETIKKLNILRKKAGQKPLKEKEIDINDEISESKILTGYVKKNKKAKKLVDLIMKKKNPKDIGKEFKKLTTKDKEAFMNALGDVEDETLLQRGNVVKQLIAMYDEVTPKLDGRSKAFKEKLRKLEYNKKKKLPYEMFEKTNVKEKKLGALQKKADKTGIPYGILKQVFNRGVAAWRTGHRPGTNPTQWGYARVNSFATKSKGTWGGADKDLAAKARKSM